jgi:hypothetical protein
MWLANTDKRYVFIPVLNVPPGVEADLLTWQVALVPDDGGEPASGDWKTGTWEDQWDAVSLLVGPGTPNVYGPDTHYMAWLSCTAGSERPVLRSGRVTIGAPD